MHAQETFAKLSDSIFFETASPQQAPLPGASSTTPGTEPAAAAAPLELTIAQLWVPSSLVWEAAGVNVTLASTTSADGRAMLAKLSLTDSSTRLSGEASPPLRLKLRVPSWIVASDSVISPAPTGGGLVPGSWARLDVTAAASAADNPAGGATRVVMVRFGMGAWLQHLNDNRPEYRGVYSIMYGPLLLAGLTTRDNELAADPSKVTEWVQLSQPNATAAATTMGAAVAGCGEANTTYLYRPGALNVGDDVQPPANATAAEAEAHCTALGSKCAGFTYHGPRDNTERAKVYYKSGSAGSNDPAWSTYLKPEPPPKTVGRVLRFVARGEDGKQIHLVPLQRIVDESYCTTFNISGGGLV